MLNYQVIGAAEIVSFPELNWSDVKARIDTGARTSAMHCARISVQKTEEGDFLNFWLELDPAGKATRFSTRDFFQKEVRSSFGQVEKRFTIRALVIIRGRRLRGKFTLTNRRKMTYPVLIGRNFLKGRFLVDVSVKTPEA